MPVYIASPTHITIKIKGKTVSIAIQVYTTIASPIDFGLYNGSGFAVVFAFDSDSNSDFLYSSFL